MPSGCWLVAYLAASEVGRAARLTGWLFVAGTVLFSGSLYALTVDRDHHPRRGHAAGGLAFLAGWLVLAWTALRR